ncbi:MAG TPA: PASTA domain-containing protein, partial [Actinomycetota bacterium]|nr:PASTA domain-containing protein [Actinomycetota bacterium]
PDVIGEPQGRAERILERAGFTVRVREEPHDQVEEGRVFDQNPKPETSAPENSEVTILVSTGPEPVEVPNLIGKSLDDARADLQAAGLRLGSVERVESEEAPDTVLDQSPDAGREVRPGREVNVVVSRGITTVVVPRVDDCVDEGTAQARLEDAGLQMRVVGEEVTTACPAGRIFRQDPGAGESVQAGSRVRVWKSAGPPPTSPSPTATASPSP